MKELLNYWPSLFLLIISVIAYGIKELHTHGKLRFAGLDNRGFWGIWSYDRKYKLWMRNDIVIDKVQAPNTFYYRFFKIKYKERFPLSATLLVSLTDGYHAMQFIYVNGICLAIALLFPNTLLTFVIVRGIWGLFFTSTYKLLSR